MKKSELDAIESFLRAPYGGETHRFLSSLQKGLEDCRLATNRNVSTGAKLSGGNHDSWVGALGYLSILDLIGNCLTKEDSKNQVDDEFNPLVSALQTFSELPQAEISAIYALRCAFAHDFSLYNFHPRKPELTHYFRLFPGIDGPVVQLPTVRWEGDYRNRPPERATAIGLTLLGDLVENIVLDLQELGRDEKLRIKLSGGAEELSDRYSVMQILEAS
jgi:hypothetical protein